MKKILILLTISSSFFFTACKKEAGPQIATIEIKFSADALSWVQLPVNRYFIYKDSATGKIDSVVVTESKTGEISVPEHKSMGYFDFPHPAYTYQTFSLTLIKYTGVSKEIWFNSDISSDVQSYLFFPPLDPPVLNINNAFWFPFNSYVTFRDFQVSQTAAINIEGKNYLDAISFTTTNGVDAMANNYIKNTYTWVKGIGIIKREMRTSTGIKTEFLVRNN